MDPYYDVPDHILAERDRADARAREIARACWRPFQLVDPTAAPLFGGIGAINDHFFDYLQFVETSELPPEREQ